jgi:membrane protease YdiL (CAAX protease family)
MDDRAAGWLLAAALGILLVALVPRERRAWALAAAALLLLYALVLAAATWLLPAGAALWSPAIAAVAVWLVVQPLLALRRLDRADVGLVPPVAGSLGVAAVVTAGVLLINAAVITVRGPPSLGPGVAVAAAVTLAAVMEELVMRGAVLALADRALPPRWTIAGARIGLGGVLVTSIFVALHGLRPGLLLGVLPAALLYLWLRARTGSLAPPIAAHILWNLSVVLLHA